MFEDVSKEKQQDLDYFFFLVRNIHLSPSNINPLSALDLSFQGSHSSLGIPDAQKQILTCILQLETQYPQVFPAIHQHTPNSVVPEPRLAVSRIKILWSSAEWPRENQEPHLQKKPLWVPAKTSEPLLGPSGSKRQGSPRDRRSHLRLMSLLSPEGLLVHSSRWLMRLWTWLLAQSILPHLQLKSSFLSHAEGHSAFKNQIQATLCNPVL